MSKGKIKTTEQFIKDAKLIHGNKYDYSKVEYKKSNINVCICCPKHGDFWQKAHDHVSGCGCPKCVLKSQENIFSFIKESFINEKWEWEFSPDWLGSQRFDIYCKRVNLAIEYNGIQHYFPIEIFGGKESFEKCVKRDVLKEQLCKDNNCTLYIIKYDNVDYDKIKEDINNILNLK